MAEEEKRDTGFKLFGSGKDAPADDPPTPTEEKPKKASSTSASLTIKKVKLGRDNQVLVVIDGQEEDKNAYRIMAQDAFKPEISKSAWDKLDKPHDASDALAHWLHTADELTIRCWRQGAFQQITPAMAKQADIIRFFNVVAGLVYPNGRHVRQAFTQSEETE